MRTYKAKWTLFIIQMAAMSLSLLLCFICCVWLLFAAMPAILSGAPIGLMEVSMLATAAFTGFIGVFMAFWIVRGLR